MKDRACRLGAIPFLLLSVGLSACSPGLAPDGGPDAVIDASSEGRASIVVQPAAEAAPPGWGDAGGPCDDAPSGPPGDGGADTPDACATGEVHCGGQCVDLQTDPKSCGACGHDCAPGTCAAGTCEPWVVFEPADPAAIASDGANVVWANAGASDVYQVPADGSAHQGGATPVTLSRPGGDSTIAVAMASSAVVWARLNYTTQQSTLWEDTEGAAEGGALVASALDPVGGLALASHGAYAYLATVSGTAGRLWRCNVAGASPPCTSLHPVSSTSLGPIAVDDQSVYWADPGNALVSRYVLATGAVENFATGQMNPAALALDDASVYWVTNTGADFSIKGTSKISAAAPALLVASPGYATALATDGVNLYVATSGGIVGAVPVTGGALATLHTSARPDASSRPPLVYAAGAIYWGDKGMAAIYGLRVP